MGFLIIVSVCNLNPFNGFNLVLIWIPLIIRRPILHTGSDNNRNIATGTNPNDTITNNPNSAVDTDPCAIIDYGPNSATDSLPFLIVPKTSINHIIEA